MHGGALAVKTAFTCSRRLKARMRGKGSAFARVWIDEPWCESLLTHFTSQLTEIGKKLSVLSAFNKEKLSSE